MRAEVSWIIWNLEFGIWIWYFIVNPAYFSAQAYKKHKRRAGGAMFLILSLAGEAGADCSPGRSGKRGFHRVIFRFRKR